MRAFSRIVVLSVLGFGLPTWATAQDLVPERRFILSQDADLPGGDLTSIFDTTIEACEQACLANAQCTAFTFNTRNGSCFPKNAPGEEAFYQGGFSGRIVAADATVIAQAPARRAEIGFLQDYDLSGAYTQAIELANLHTSGLWTAQEHLQSAQDAELDGNMLLASQFTGAALNVSDAPETWVDYARLLIEVGTKDSNNSRMFWDRAFSATVNGYLRAKNPAMQHTALVQMGLALEKIDRGSDMVRALRLAQDIQPRDDTNALLESAAGKYGFRITEHDVQSDTARPRVCATFSEDLVASGVDYSSFVQLPEPGLTVEAGGWRQLCVEGMAHGARYTLTFREGLPAADGQTMAKSVPITAYVRDRSPGVRFPGRAYVLPKNDNAALPVETVNTDKLDLTLFRVSDRNLLRSIQN
ncbi:MAG: PAN domain-containing protein, partial [Paracoccaceae bacterium]